MRSAAGARLPERERGRIRFVHERGFFGFIIADGAAGEEDVYIAASAIPAEGLRRGQRVAFTRVPRRDRPGSFIAHDIEAIEE